MRLLFCYLSEKITRDKNGLFYTTGNFTPEVWNRYLSLSDNLHVLMTEVPEKVNIAVAKQSKHPINTQNLTIHPVPQNTDSVKSYFSIKISRERMKIIENEIKNADAVIIRTPSKSLVGLCQKYNKPYAVEVVGCVWDSLWNHSLKGKVLALQAFIDAKRIIKKSPYVLYVTKEFLQQRYPTEGKTTHCSNVSLNPPNEDILVRRLEKIRNQGRKFILGTAAGLNVRYKGQQYVIRALGELKKHGITNFEYQLIGGGSSDYLMRQAKRFNVEDQINIIGQLNHERVFEWLQNVDIYIQPSLQEGLPRSVIEAMSCGIPCIGTKVAGIPELLDHEMLFEGKDYKAIARILKGITKEEMCKMSQQNFFRAKEYDVDVLKKRRHNFYVDFLKNSLGSSWQEGVE